MARPSLILERYCALICGVVAGSTCWITWGRVPFPANWKELLGPLFTASATGAGFLFTSASILISMDHQPILKWGRQTGAYELLACYLNRGIAWCLLSALGSLLMFLPNFTTQAWWHRMAFSGWWLVMAGSAIAVVRVFLIFAAILGQVARDRPSARRNEGPGPTDTDV